MIGGPGRNNRQGQPNRLPSVIGCEVGFLRLDWLVDLLPEEIREVDKQGRKGDER